MHTRSWLILARLGCGLGLGLGGVWLGLRPYLDPNRNQNAKTAYQPRDPSSQIVMGPPFFCNRVVGSFAISGYTQRIGIHSLYIYSGDLHPRPIGGG